MWTMNVFVLGPRLLTMAVQLWGPPVAEMCRWWVQWSLPAVKLTPVGATTLTLTVSGQLVQAGEVVVIVTVYAPGTVSVVVATVSVTVPGMPGATLAVMELREAVMSVEDGTGAAKVAVPLNPPTLVAVMVLVPEEPATMVGIGFGDALKETAGGTLRKVAVWGVSGREPAVPMPKTKRQVIVPVTLEPVQLGSTW
jgi:hypothetical protein